MEPLENEAEAPLLAVLRIDLIMWKVETFLELEDLKSMRLVSRAMNQLILWQTKFLSKSKLILKSSVYENPCFKKVSFRPKNVAFETIQVGSDDNGSKREEMIHLVCKLVESCEYLEIRESRWLMTWLWRQYWDCKDKTVLDNLSPPEYFPRVLDLILCVENLKELKCCAGNQVLFNQATKEHEYSLSGLKKIEFETASTYTSTRYPPMCCPPILFKRKGLMTILGYRCEDFSSTSAQHERFRDLVINNKETFIEMDLTRRCKFCCSTFFGNIFPSLKSLKLAQNWERKDDLLALQFLGNHMQNLEILSYLPPPLREDNVCQVFGKYTVPCMKKLKLLYRIKFEQKRKSLVSCMTHIRESLIEDFHLELETIPPYSDWDDVETDEAVEILSLLPTTLRSLIVKGCSAAPLTYDYSKLKYFPHLRHLKLYTFVGPLNSTLEAIFKYLVKLRSLHINCVTDVPEAERSSTAEPEDNPTGSTIVTKTFVLKDLETVDVEIRRKGRISMDIINGMKCSKLKTFGVGPMDQEFSTMTLVKLFQDNPCLSYVYQYGARRRNLIKRKNVTKDNSDLAAALATWEGEYGPSLVSSELDSTDESIEPDSA